jgi:hypothetical protein
VHASLVRAHLFDFGVGRLVVPFSFPPLAASRVETRQISGKMTEF